MKKFFARIKRSIRIKLISLAERYDWANRLLPFYRKLKNRKNRIIRGVKQFKKDLSIRFERAVNKLKYRLNHQFRVEADKLTEAAVKKPLSEREKRFIYFDLCDSHYKYGSLSEDYFYLEFYRKSDLEKNEYVTRTQYERIVNTCNPKQYHAIFKNKYQTYAKFYKFYKREILWIRDETDFEKFKEFCHIHKTIFIKPFNRSWGFGAEKITIKDDSHIKKLFQQCLEKKLIVEEVIRQNSELAAFHPNSLNTLRINTIVTKHGVKLMDTVLKIGNHEAIVDNTKYGGMFATIDNESGIIYTPGIDKYDNRYLRHPLTHKPIIGFQIPRWEDVKVFVMELALVVPENRLVGWDIAINDKDEVVLVEANHATEFYVCQGANQIGTRRMYEEAMKDIW